MEGPPLAPGGKDVTWPDQVAPRGRKASSTRKIKPQTSNLNLVLFKLGYETRRDRYAKVMGGLAPERDREVLLS